MIRALSLLWLFVQALALSVWGWGLLAATFLYIPELADALKDGPPDKDFAARSVLYWLLIGSYVVGLRLWWPYAKGVMRAVK